MNTPEKIIEDTEPPNINSQRCLFEHDSDEKLSCDEMEISNVESPESEDDSFDTDLQQLINYLPSVLENLRKFGQEQSFIKWCCLVSENKIPLDNICYLLFLDLIEWYSKPVTTQMRYFRSETRQFWEVGYRLFKGKFLRFMSGPRNLGQIISGSNQRGRCLPQDSKINFAIPAINNLNEDRLLPIYPGVLEDSISLLTKHLPSKYVKLGVDGKKISRRKGKTMGDIDCWGFEAKPTLLDRKIRYQNEMITVDEMIQRISKYDLADVTGIPSVVMAELTEDLQKLIVTISLRVKDLRYVLLRLNQGIQKFLKLGESTGDWRKSRYAPVIGCLKVAKYDTEQAILNAMHLLNDICLVCAKVNKTQNLYCYASEVSLSSQGNYHELRPNNDPSDTTHVKQRTDPWHSIRKEALVTGSTCNVALGLGQLKQQQAHFDKVISGNDSPAVSEDQRRNMEYGTIHETDAIATVVGRVLPAVFPTLEYFEEGCVRIAYNDKESFLVVSPDGSLKESQNAVPKMMYETKCKTSNLYTTDVNYEIPKYYVTQLLCEMFAYDCKELLLTCWPIQSTTVFRVMFDENLWQCIWEAMCTLYGTDKPKRPTKFPANVAAIKTKITEFLQTNVSFLGKFPSCVATNAPENNFQYGDGAYIACSTSVSQKDDSIAPENLLSTLHNVRKWQEEAYQLCRTTATEILMFMVNDLDRRYHMEISNSHPVAYALKGPSMSNETLREMTDYVIQKYIDNGLSVLATSSDGQWHKYGTRDNKNKPLTVLQLQKDVWSESKKPKSVLLKEFRSRYRVNKLDDVIFEKLPNGTIVVHGHKRDSNLTIFQAPRGRFGPCIIDTMEKVIEGNRLNADSDHDIISDSVGTLSDLTGFVSEEIACAYDEETMVEIDKMLLSVDSNLQASSISFMDHADMGLDLQTLFREGTANVSRSIVDPYAKGTETTEGKTDVLECAQYEFSEETEPFYPFNLERLNEGETITEIKISTTQSLTTNSDIPMFNDGNETSISGVVHSAFATIYDRREFQSSDMFASSGSVLQQTMENDAKSLPNNYAHPIDTTPLPVDPESVSVLSEASSSIPQLASPSENLYQVMLTQLQVDENASKKNSWSTKTVRDISDVLHTKDVACKTLSAKELKICLCALKETREKVGIKFYNSWNKAKLYDSLHATLTSDSEQHQPMAYRTRRHGKSPPKLITLVSKFINSIPRDSLASVISEEIWRSKYAAWIEQSQVKNDIKMNDYDQPIRWFSKPNNECEGNVRFHFTDCCHILTCLRIKICTTGIEGLRRQAWVKAAESDETTLNLAIVVECLDKQSVAFANRLFGEDVERFMLENGYENEGAFVRLIRLWFEDPGNSKRGTLQKATWS